MIQEFFKLISAVFCEDIAKLNIHLSYMDL